MSLLKYKNAKKLHLALFSEEYDYMDDSYADSCDRNSGKNPMNQEYQAKVNRKRELLEVSPLSSGGLSADESAMEFCIKEIQASNLSTPLETNVKLASDSSSFVINEALRALYEKRTEPKDQLLVILKDIVGKLSVTGGKVGELGGADVVSGGLMQEGVDHHTEKINSRIKELEG